MGDLFTGRRVIAPSRFGYLGSAMPPGARSANQSEAFVALICIPDYIAAYDRPRTQLPQ